MIGYDYNVEHQLQLEVPSALHLVQLLDKVKENVKRKQITKENETRIANKKLLEIQQRQQLSGDDVLDSFDDKGVQVAASGFIHAGAGAGGESKSNPRRRYQDYFQSRAQAVVLIDEYNATLEERKYKQRDRLISLGQTMNMLTDLKNPLTLEEGRKAIRECEQRQHHSSYSTANGMSNEAKRDEGHTSGSPDTSPKRNKFNLFVDTGNVRDWTITSFTTLIVFIYI